MQSAKKLVLLDEFDREYKRLQRPTAAVAKTNNGLRLSNTLRDGSLADDHKVRQYVGELHRYLNVNNREPSAERPTPTINWVTEPEPIQPRKRVVEKRRKRKRAVMPRARCSGTNIDAPYTDPRAPGSFSSVRNLRRYSGRSERDVKKFLSGRDVYTMHKPRRLRFLDAIIIIIMTRRQLRSVATTLHDDRDPVPSSTPV